MKIGIKYKSVIFLALLLLMALGISGYMVLQGIEQNQRQAYEEQLAQEANTALLYLQQAYAKSGGESVPEFLKRTGYQLAQQIGQMVDTHVVLYDMEGREIGNSAPGLSGADTEDALQYALQNKTAYQVSNTNLYYLTPVVLQDEQAAAVQFYYSLQGDQEFYHKIKTLFLLTGTVIFFAAFILGYQYFGRIAKGIYSLKLAVESIKQGRYKDIPEINRRDELGELRQGIYYMSSQIEQSLKDMEAEQQKLVLAVEKLKALEQQQRLFIGNVSHEFKTPLTVIKAYMDLLEMYPEDDKLLLEAKENIGKETERLHQMVEKTLQLAVLEKYEFELDMQPVELKELLREICRPMEAKMQKQGLHLYKDLETARIQGDRESLFQIFVNLLDNAIRYNRPKGEILVKSYGEKETAYVEIRDTGIGIPRESVEKVFEAFYTVDKARSRQYGGTGLGLSLVKQLVEKQKGTIEIKESNEEGTFFVIKFPLL
jgi:two-component system phosphate regulon sensor histidine kinase PhoR